MEPPSSGAVRGDVSAAQLANESATAKANQILNQGAAPQAPITLSLLEDTTKIKNDLADAQAQIVSLQSKVDTQTGQLNKETDRLNYLEPKYSESVGLVWKWRLIAIGIGAAVVGFFILRQYIPFLKLI